MPPETESPIDPNGVMDVDFYSVEESEQPKKQWKDQLDLEYHPMEDSILEEGPVEGRSGLTMEVWAGDLYTSMSMMVDKMYEPLKNGEYGVILGEDASGRIPALVMRHLMKRINELQDRPDPKILFVAGMSGAKDKLRSGKINALVNYLRPHFSSMKKQPQNYQNKVLIVSDTISSGDSMEGLATAMNELQQPWDVASVGSYITTEEKWHGGRIYYGRTNTPRIYNKHSLAGVKKSPYDVLAKSIRNINDPTLLKSQELINHVREQVKVIGDLLFNEFMKRKKAEESAAGQTDQTIKPINKRWV